MPAEYQRAMDFIEAAESCADLGELRCVLSNALEQFGVPYFTLGAMLREGQGAPTFTTLIRGVTQDWSEYYWDRKCFNIDVAVHRAMQSAAPFSWSEVEHRRLSRTSQRLFGDIRDALKIRGGFVIPVHDEMGFAGVIALHHEDPDLTPQQTAALKLIAIYGIECAKELYETEHGLSRRAPAPCPLSPRQREILAYAAAGKSESDTGEILGIAGSTVREHMEKVRDLLGVRTKTQAVAVAVQRGWIVL